MHYTGRDPSWIIVLSALAPDLDMVADRALRNFGFTVLFHGSPITHGDFHNLAVLLLYASVVTLCLHPLGVRFADGFIFAGIGFAAHFFEDALVAEEAYPFLWPFLSEGLGLGLLPLTRPYTHSLYGLANIEVLLIGILATILAMAMRTWWQGSSWLTNATPLRMLKSTLTILRPEEEHG